MSEKIEFIVGLVGVVLVMGVAVMCVQHIKSEQKTGKTKRAWVKECVLEHKYAESTCRIIYEHNKQEE